MYLCIIQEQLWALFKLRNVYFVLSKLQLNCYKRAWCATFIVVSEPRFRRFYKMILKLFMTCIAFAYKG